MTVRVVAVAALVLLFAFVGAVAGGQSAVDHRNADVAHQTVTHAGVPTGLTPGPRGTP